MNEQKTPPNADKNQNNAGNRLRRHHRSRRRRHQDRSGRRQQGTPRSEVMKALQADEDAATDVVTDVVTNAVGSDVADVNNDVIADENAPLTDAGAEEAPVTPAKEYVEIVGVRFRSNAKTYYFDPRGVLYRVGCAVIVETSRGMEFGTVTIANRPVDTSLIVPPLRAIVRVATENDLARNEKNRAMEKEAAVIGAERIEKYGLDMKIVDVEYTFDNSKLLFYFTSEARVDFRELVKNLASIFKTRIELRQIGIRDEARLMGGLGACGRPFCCSSFLSDFTQVSIKMAKEQNFSLNSAKISGSCGRLMCCLRYEHDAYEEALKNTPSNGTLVSTPNGEGIVIETRPLAGMVKVRFEDKNDSPKYYSCSELTVLGKPRRTNNNSDATEHEGEKKQGNGNTPRKANARNNQEPAADKIADEGQAETENNG